MPQFALGVKGNYGSYDVDERIVLPIVPMHASNAKSPPRQVPGQDRVSPERVSDRLLADLRECQGAFAQAQDERAVQNIRDAASLVELMDFVHHCLCTSWHDPG